MEKINKFWQLSGVEKWLIIEAVFFLTFAQLTTRLVPFRFIAPGLGKHMELPREEGRKYDEQRIAQIGQIIHKAANNVPWNSVCLPQAIAAKLMLRRRNVKSTLFLGVRKCSKKELSAHAWLMVGDLVVTGQTDENSFRVVSNFT